MASNEVYNFPAHLTFGDSAAVFLRQKKKRFCGCFYTLEPSIPDPVEDEFEDVGAAYVDDDDDVDDDCFTDVVAGANGATHQVNHLTEDKTSGANDSGIAAPTPNLTRVKRKMRQHLYSRCVCSVDIGSESISN